MRIKRKTIVGRIDERGNLTADMALFHDYCMLNKGRAVFVRMEIQPKEPSEKMRNYVFGYIVPEMQSVFHDNGEDYTKVEVFSRLKALCPVFLEEEYIGNGEWKTRQKEWEELDSAEAVEFVAWVQRFAAENYYHIVEDPVL